MGMFDFGAGKVPQKVAGITVPASGNAQAVTGPAVFFGIVILTNGTDNVTYTVYNGTSNAGQKVTLPAAVLDGSRRTGGVAYPIGLPCPNGIYVECAGTGNTWMVMYDQG